MQLTPTEQRNLDLTVILTSLGDEGTSAGKCYIALNMEVRRWEIVRHLCVAMEWITIDGNSWVMLTPGGKDFAATLEATLAAAR